MTATTCHHATEYRGHSLEVFYSEERCRWYCFVAGIGTKTGGIKGDEQGAIDAAKAAVDCHLGGR